jgi:hypothetical protein
LLPAAAITFGAVVAAIAALDDITTDDATSFAFERAGLVWLTPGPTFGLGTRRCVTSS